MSAVNKAITIVIADDHPIFRAGLKGVLDANPSFHVIAEADNGADALAQVRELAPDVVVLDIEMPIMSGLDAAAILYEEKSPVKRLILSMYQEEAIFNRAIDCGVTGYMLKDSAATDIVKAIVAVHAGEYYFSPALSTFAIRESGHPDCINAIVKVLSPMELTVLRMIAIPRSTREIADILFISLRTVENHRFHICRKLGLNGSYALLRFALSRRDEFGISD